MAGVDKLEHFKLLLAVIFLYSSFFPPATFLCIPFLSGYVGKGGHVFCIILFIL